MVIQVQANTAEGMWEAQAQAETSFSGGGIRVYDMDGELRSVGYYRVDPQHGAVRIESDGRLDPEIYEFLEQGLEMSLESVFYGD